MAADVKKLKETKVGDKIDSKSKKNAKETTDGAESKQTSSLV